MAGSNGIQVDCDDLNAFAGNVDNQTTKEFRPNVENAMSAYRLGTKFGNGLSMVSPALRDARGKYQACLETASLTLAEYIRTSDILVTAIKKAQEGYSSADGQAATINGAILTQAMSDVSKIMEERRAAGKQSLENALEVNKRYGAGAPTLPGEHQL